MTCAAKAASTSRRCRRPVLASEPVAAVPVRQNEQRLANAMPGLTFIGRLGRPPPCSCDLSSAARAKTAFRLDGVITRFVTDARPGGTLRPRVHAARARSSTGSTNTCHAPLSRRNSDPASGREMRSAGFTTRPVNRSSHLGYRRHPAGTRHDGPADHDGQTGQDRLFRHVPDRRGDAVTGPDPSGSDGRELQRGHP